MGRILTFLRLTTWRRRIIALLVLFPAVMIPATEVTSTSAFCGSCHIMHPYYDSWSHGSHKQVSCVQCHIAPGVDNMIAAKLNGLGQVVDDVLHRTSMKPSASVSQLSCTRSGCHDVERLKASNTTMGKFMFKHEKHLGLEYLGIKVACATCHSHVSGEKHFEVNTNACVTCHLLRHDGAVAAADPQGSIHLAVREVRTTLANPGAGAAASTAGAPALASSGAGSGEAAAAHGVVGGVGASAALGGAATGHGKLPPSTCTSCHTPPAGTIERGGLKITHADYLSYGAACESCHRGVTAAPTPVESGQCFECHNFGIERTMPPEEMHRVHNEGRHKVECFSCHGTVHHGPTAQIANLQQFDCRKCHTDQHGVQRRAYLEDGSGPTAADGAPTVSPMFLAHVDCTGCHVKKRPVSTRPGSGATVAAASPEACDDCHKPGLGKELIPLWQKSTHGLFDQAEADLKSATVRVKSEEGLAQLAEARRLLEMVRADGSWGVHNPKYTQRLLEQARGKIGAARAGAPTEASP